MKKLLQKALPLALLASTAVSAPVSAAPQREKLDRALTAFKVSDGVFLSWRWLDTDPEDTYFDIYRDGEKINSAPVSTKTNYTDASGSASSKYVVKAVSSNASAIDPVALETKETNVITDPYLRIKLQRPESGVSAPGGADQMSKTDYTYTYTPNDCSVGDVDGDGEYEIFVKWDPSNSADNSFRRNTGPVYIDCYRLDGTLLWRVNLGQNIRAGAHYTQFLVYDFDGDGKAELVCKTAPGTIDGTGTPVLMDDDKVTDDYRTKSGSNTGIIVSGPEYLTVFDGLTGANRATVAYDPPRSIRSNSQWGDSYGNRSERYLAAVAYLDGQHPSIVMCRGYYTASYLAAWDFDGTTLKQRWLHKSESAGKGIYGEGAHSLTVGDVDGDGFDEIVYGAACVDHDGSTLYRTGGGHGDALHLGDFDPDREGLEVFMVHEEKSSSYPYDAEFRDAKTGEIIWYLKQSGNDIGRGLCGDISPLWHGYECWPGSYFPNGTETNATFDCKGNIVADGKRPSTNFRIYWDEDLLDELFDGRYDSGTGKCDPKVTKRSESLMSDSKTWTFGEYNAQACNTTKATPCLQADILGDWREELILWDGENSTDLLVFQSTIPTTYRVPCLMTDHNYRMAIAWQNVGYNQPPHLGYYLYDTYNNDPKITVTSGSLTQTVELGDEIIPIKGTFSKCTGLISGSMPKGLTLTVDNDAKTFEVTGAPLATGTARFTLYSQGGLTQAFVTASLNVIEPVELTEVAHYSFDEVGSEVTNHIFGSAKANGSPAAVEGVKDGAMRLNGVTDHISQEAYPEIQTGEKDFTIEFWMRSDDDAAYILHKGSIAADAATGTTGNWIGLELKNGNLTFAVDDDVTKSTAVAPAAAYFNNEWTHVVCVREKSANSLKLYLNGQLVAEGADATGAIKDNNEPLTVGNVNVDFNNALRGELDDFHIYYGAMPASRVLKRYNEVMNPEPEPPVSAVETLDAFCPKELTLVDAQSGVIVATGVGEPENILTRLDENESGKVYILVIRQGRSREMIKIVR